MTTLSSLTTMSLVLLTTNLTNASMETVTVSLDEGCPHSFTRLDLHEKVVVKTRSWPKQAFPAQANASCRVEFMTALEDHGICFDTNQISFIQGQDSVKIQFYTYRYGPDKIVDRFHFEGLQQWCTDQPLVTMELVTSQYLPSQQAEFLFSFNVKNVSVNELTREFVMDSYKHCNLTYKLNPGESIEVIGQRYPPPHSLPSVCQLTLTTSGGGEFEQLCVQVPKYRNRYNCQGTLEVVGFHGDYWKETQYLGCNDNAETQLANKWDTLCSADKRLTFTLYRKDLSDTGMSFTAKVKSMQHPHWEEISSMEEQMKGLGFVKGLTFFIATIDSLAGILGAVLATMIRHPKSFWKEWALSIKPPSEKCEAVHYEVSYPEVSCSKVEEVSEAKAY